MKVRLIAVTKPVIEECPDADSLVAYCARVSNPDNQNNLKTASRLLQYLVKHGHWSPFEMAHMVVEIETTRDIARQILRHRSFSFQEFSQRYAHVPPKAKFREARLQDPSNRQSSLPCADPKLVRQWEADQKAVADMASAMYHRAIKSGIAKEVARAVLPEGMTPSVLYMAGSLRSFIHYCHLRTDAATQKEHQEIALAIEKLVMEQFPALDQVL